MGPTRWILLDSGSVSFEDKNDSGLIDKEEFIKALQNPEELLAKPEEKKEPASSSMMSYDVPLYHIVKLVLSITDFWDPIVCWVLLMIPHNTFMMEMILGELFFED